MKRYDLAIIGSGPGGYVAALYAARHAMKVCVIEKGQTGGTCLNRGCIPTKSLLHAASLVRSMQTAPSFGISIDGYHADFSRITARKNEVVARLRTGIETLFRASKIDLMHGEARLLPENVIELPDGEQVGATDIIIAAGSRPRGLPDAPCDHLSILSSDSILDIAALPASLAIIGGGSIGCEFAEVFSALGVAVTIIEATDRLIPTQSRQASRKLEQAFAKKGIACHTGRCVESVGTDGAVRIQLSDGTTCCTEKVLVAVGRAPATENLNLAACGIRTNDGRIVVDEELRTTTPHVYAVGDCVIGPQLAHKASYDGILACDNIRGGHRKADYSSVPNCVWTDPQVASVGLSEEEAKARLPEVKVATFPFLASGKAYLLGKSDGFVKIVGEPSGGTILGVEIVGEDACELIAEAVVAKTAGMTVAEWSQVVHGHPTLSEALYEAARAFCGAGIHSL